MKIAATMIEFWQAVAERLKPYSDTVWGYDLLNEPLDRNQLPHAPTEWRPLAERLIAAIRAVDPQAWIIYEAGPGGGAEGLRDFTPFADSRIIYSSHFYTPHSFTHQGIYDIRGTDLARAYEEVKSVYPGVLDGEWFDQKRLEAELAVIDEFLASWPAPYYLGEFSVVRWAPDGSAERYLTDLIPLFERRGWSWSYHAFREFHGWSLEYDDSYWIDGMPGEPTWSGDSRRGAIVRKFLQGVPIRTP